MSKNRESTWIDVYPIKNRYLDILGTGARLSYSQELAQYIQQEWQPKAEKGWVSSWVAFAKSIRFNADNAIVDAGAVQFHEIHGMNKSIESNLPFAPESGYVPCLSVGFITATSDGKVILQRRGPDVHVPNTLIHEPTGYMASVMFTQPSKADKPEFAHDPRLFDIYLQLEARKNKIASTFGVDKEIIAYSQIQDFLAAGWLTTEMYFSTTGRINAESKDLTVPEKGEFLFIPFDELKSLILNQGRLARVNRANHRPEDVREIPLIDESILGLIYSYQELTGDLSLDPEETIDRLNHDGLDIRVYDTTPGQVYQFPSSF